MVPFVGRRGVETAIGIADIAAEEIAERAVITADRNGIATGGVVAARAIGLARGQIVADIGAVLARRVHHVPLEAAGRRQFIPDGVIDAGTEFDPVVAAGIAHDDPVITPLARERIESCCRVLIRCVRFADLDRAPGGRGDADVSIAVEQRAVDLIGEVAVRLFQARRCRNIETDFELIDKAQIVRRGQFLEAADAKVRQVRGDVRQPAEIADRILDAAVGIGRARKPARDAFRRDIERHVDIAIAGDLAARRLEGERIAGLMLEEPAVLVGGLDGKIGDFGFGLRRCGLGLRGLRLGFGGLLLRRLRVRRTLRLLGLQLLDGLLQLIDLRLQGFELRIGRALGGGRETCSHHQHQ